MSATSPIPQNPKPPAAKAKLRRVSRACDSCRIKKAKCDGNRPCSSCNLHNVECTYDDPRTARRRDPKYVQDLERTVQRLSALLGMTGGSRPTDEWLPGTASTSSTGFVDDISEHSAPSAPAPPLNQGALLETMIEATGQLSVDKSGNCDYRGNFAGLTILRRIRERCDMLLTGHPITQREGDPIWACGFQPFQPPTPPSPSIVSEHAQNIFPPKDIALQLVATAFNDAFPLLQILHKPSFMQQLEEHYAENNISTDGIQDPRFAGLLYEVLALGELYSGSSVGINTYEEGKKQRAEMYFLAGQDLLDITDCRDLTSLQAMVCIVIYLQSSAMITTCYSFISLALTACTRMGLHRSATSRNFNYIVRESRKRTFWVLRTMDTYVTTILGLPKTLSDEDIDQDLPAEIDDEFISEQVIKSATPKEHSSMTAVVNAHIKLLRIMDKVKKYVHGGSTAEYEKSGSYRVDYSRVAEVERDLAAWFAALPDPANLQEPVSFQLEKAQLLLRLFYAHVQMVLYRPFLHHIGKNKTDPDFDIHAYACASACIHAAMQVIWLDETLKARGYLNGSYWFTVYITFFAVVCLVMFHLSNKHDPTSVDAISAANRGYRILMEMATSSFAAKRCIECLQPLLRNSALVAGPLQLFSNASGLDAQLGAVEQPVNHCLITSDPAYLMDPLPNQNFTATTFFPGPVNSQEPSNEFAPDMLRPDLQAMVYAPIHPFLEQLNPELLEREESMGENEDDLYRLHVGELNKEFGL